jgi:hypothetical protein
MSYRSGDSAVFNASLWRPLRLLNYCRMVIAGLLLVIILSSGLELLGKHNPRLFILASASYVFFSLTLGVPSH